ncbi:MAG: hypothetical protein JNK85_02990 [Verrucomicrobiales bacterium]|nr:hypothetical protein [Verrucomicrobiales bacterium]
MNASSLAGTSHPSDPNPGAGGTVAPRKRRRWWVYGLWAVGTLFVLFLSLVIAAALYWNHLVKTYTSTSPKTLPTVESPREKFEALKERWQPFALSFIKAQPIEPFEMTDEDLNAFANQFGPMKNQVHLGIMEERVRAEFSINLDRSGNSSLSGRYLNGVAYLKVDYKKGRVSSRVISIDANNRPVPKWLLRRAQQINWLSALNHRPEFDLAIRGLDRIEMKPGALVLHPKAPGAAPR